MVTMKKLFNFFASTNIKFNLLQLLILLTMLVLLITITLVIFKIITKIHKQQKIDESLRAKRARIARVLTEITGQKGGINETGFEPEVNNFVLESINIKPTLEQIQIFNAEKPVTESLENIDKQQNISQEEIQTESLIEETRKLKKTRAMSMEERWADYEKKRSSKWHTA